MMKIIGILVICYVLYAVIGFFVQRMIVFPGTSIEPLPQPDQKKFDAKSVMFDVPGGNVEAWFLHAKRVGKRPAVIFAHGNGELIDHWPAYMSSYLELGIHVLLVEYPGYGRSAGTPSAGSIQDVFIRAFDWLKANDDVDGRKIIGHGRSLGGGAICQLQKSRPLSAMILQSTFTDISKLAVRFLLPPILVRDHFNNIAVVRMYKGPVLIMHGRYDTVISYKNAKQLYKAALDGNLITYECGHNNFPTNWESYWSDIRTFLEKSAIL